MTFTGLVSTILWLMAISSTMGLTYTFTGWIKPFYCPNALIEVTREQLQQMFDSLQAYSPNALVDALDDVAQKAAIDYKRTIMKLTEATTENRNFQQIDYVDLPTRAEDGWFIY